VVAVRSWAVVRLSHEPARYRDVVATATGSAATPTVAKPDRRSRGSAWWPRFSRVRHRGRTRGSNSAERRAHRSPPRWHHRRAELSRPRSPQRSPL